jgi:CheY-like chemotaxis protein
LRQSALQDALAAIFGETTGRTAVLPAAGADGQLGSDLSVLLVEDNPVNLQVGLGMLHSLGCTTYTALNGREALEMLDRQDFDIVLMDCQMPEMDGFEATRRQRARERQEKRRSVPIVALTANAVAGDRQRCLDAGMDDYLAKPFACKDLEKMLFRWGVQAIDGCAETAVL